MSSEWSILDVSEETHVYIYQRTTEACYKKATSHLRCSILTCLEIC